MGDIVAFLQNLIHCQEMIWMQICIHIKKKSAWNIVKFGCSCFSWESILLLRNDVNANIYHSFLAFKELTQVLSVIIVMNVMLSWNHWVIFGNCSGLKEWRFSIMQRIFCKFEEQTVLHKGIHWHRLGERRSSAKSSCNLTLIVLLDLGDNDRAARVLFVQHPREQGEWCSQNPSVARVLTSSFALLPRVLDEQHPSRPVIIPIITRNSQIRDIFTEIRTA